MIRITQEMKDLALICMYETNLVKDGWSREQLEVEIECYVIKVWAGVRLNCI